MADLVDDFAFRNAITRPIRDTIKEVDSNTWLIGPLILRRSSGHSDTATWFDDGDNSSYTITDAPTPQPPAAVLEPNKPPIVKIHDIADQQVVWTIGNKVVCKVRMVFPTHKITPEHVTLKWVQNKRPDFETPEVLYSTNHDNRYILFMTKLPGRTLQDAWPSLTAERQQYYVKAVADICESMSKWEGDRMTGVDGKNIRAYMLAEIHERKSINDFSPTALEKVCAEIGMDCSSFVFYHDCLDGSNIMIDGKNIGIIGWTTAGYFPKDWIGTNFIVSSGMDMPPEYTMEGARFRLEVAHLLETRGFELFSHEFWDWLRSKEIFLREGYKN